METFVVRVWRAAGEPMIPETARMQLRGLVEHVGTGTTARFGGGEELLQFLRRPLRPMDSETGSTSHDGGGSR